MTCPRTVRQKSTNATTERQDGPTLEEHDEIYSFMRRLAHAVGVLGRGTDSAPSYICPRND